MNMESTQDLQKLFVELFPDDEKCRLDFTWSSIALLDLFLRPLRYRQDYNLNDREIIRSSAVYLGTFLIETFEKLGEPRNQLTISSDNVSIDGPHSINLYPQLLDRVQLPVRPPDYLIQTSTALTKEESLLTNWIKEIITEFIISIQTDSTPAIMLWKTAQNHFTEPFFQNVIESSKGFSSWGKELIINSPMLLPPFEGSDLSRRYEVYFAFLKTICTNDVVEWKELSRAFLNQADPELALFGSAVGIALDDQQIIVSAFSDKKLALETAEIVRNLQVTFLSKKTWPGLLNPNTLELGQVTLNWERERGLTPFLILETELIGYPILRQIFFDIALGSIEVALKSLAILIPKAPNNIKSQLLLQQMYLAIEFNDLTLAEAVAEDVSNIARSFKPSEQALFFYLCGRLQLILQEPSKARFLFQRALSFGRFLWTDECLTYFLSICFADKDFQTVILLSGDSAFSKTTDSELVLLRILALKNVGRLEDAKTELKTAREKAPFASKLFGQYLSNQLIEK